MRCAEIVVRSAGEEGFAKESDMQKMSNAALMSVHRVVIESAFRVLLKV